MTLKIFDDVFEIVYQDQVSDESRHDLIGRLDFAQHKIFMRSDIAKNTFMSDIIYFVFRIFNEHKLLSKAALKLLKEDPFHTGFCGFLLQNEVETLIIPDALNLFGWKIKVKKVDKPKLNGKIVSGLYYSKELIIELDQNFGEQELLRTFFHECTHMIDSLSHNFNMQLNETDTDRLSLGLRSLVLNNKDLIKALRKDTLYV